MSSLDILFFLCLVAAVILHEISHGLVALLFGDDTAKRAGRLTLNPIPHLDPFGSLIVPALLVLSGAPVIGWAKPVPVNPMRLRNRRRDMLLVSLAGPGTNFVLAASSALAARGAFGRLHGFFPDFESLPLAVRFPFVFALVNLFLGLFNLLPIPPLDGSAILERALPPRALPGWYRFRPYGILVLFLLVFWTNFTGRVFEPFVDRLYNFVFPV